MSTKVLLLTDGRKELRAELKTRRIKDTKERTRNT